MRNAILLIAAVVILVLLYGYAKPKSSTSPSPSPSSSTQANAKTFTLVVKNKKLDSGPETLSVTQGDNVTINITADESEELHLHGYDKKVDLEKDKQASLNFTADTSGRFEYELEHAGVTLGVLEVAPK